MNDDDDPETPEQEAERLEFKRVRGLPVGEFVAHLQGLLVANREAMALTHLCDQLFEHLDESNRDMPRLKAIVTLILERINSPSFLGALSFYLKAPCRYAEPQELIELIAAWGNRRMCEAMTGESQTKLVAVTDPETGLTVIQPAGSEAALLRKLK